MRLQEFTADQRKAFLAAVQEREGKWDSVDPDAEIASIGAATGLSEEETFALIKQLVDEHSIDPGRVLQAGQTLRRGTSQVVGRDDILIPVGRDIRVTDKGRAEFL